MGQQLSYKMYVGRQVFISYGQLGLVKSLIAFGFSTESMAPQIGFTNDTMPLVVEAVGELGEHLMGLAVALGCAGVLDEALMEVSLGSETQIHFVPLAPS